MSQPSIHLTVLLTCCSLTLGCSPESSPTGNSTVDEASHDPHAESFAAAVTELIALRNAIRDGFAAGDIDAAHGPLHEVGHILEQLPDLASQEAFPESDQEAVNLATTSLFDAFGAVDKTLHGGEGSTYEEESAVIDQHVKTIADMANLDAAGDHTNTSDNGNEAVNEPVDAIQPVDAIAPIEAAAPVDAPAPAAVPEPQS